MNEAARFVLASGSPRRREILSRLGYRFSVRVTDAPEDDVSGDVSQIVCELARRKAEYAAASEPDALVIAADTLVSLNGTPLGKPASAADAVRMLNMLSGKTHEVISGLCLINTSTGVSVCERDVTCVTFRELSLTEIEAYVASGEPMDKAGAYAIQGGAGRFVSGYQGSYDNIVGFPSELFAEMLKNVL